MNDRSHDEMMSRMYRERPRDAAAMLKDLLLHRGKLGEWRIFLRHIWLAVFR